MLPKANRLTRRRDVQRVYSKGRGSAGEFIAIRALANRAQTFRLTVIISKKVAKRAVDRNRLKRLVRQAVQELTKDANSGQKLKGQDIILTVYKDPKTPYTLTRVQDEVIKCFGHWHSV